MKHLKIGCQKHAIDNLLLSSRYITNYMKTCPFLHPHFTEPMKVVANLFLKKTYGENLILLRAISGMSTRIVPAAANGEICLGPVFRPFSNSHQYRFQIRLRLVDVSAFSGQKSN